MPILKPQIPILKFSVPECQRCTNMSGITKILSAPTIHLQ